jgi:hypothetical protein
MKKTPALLAEVPSFRKDCRRLSGFQIGSPPKMTTEEELTIKPMKEVSACFQLASFNESGSINENYGARD